MSQRQVATTVTRHRGESTADFELRSRLEHAADVEKENLASEIWESISQPILRWITPKRIELRTMYFPRGEV